jgi:hypothetical protein
MATFLRVGQQIINLDLVTDMRFHENQVDVYLAASDKTGDPRVLVFKGEDAKELTQWFDQQARDVATENRPTGFSMSYIK